MNILQELKELVVPKRKVKPDPHGDEESLRQQREAELALANAKLLKAKTELYLGRIEDG